MSESRKVESDEVIRQKIEKLLKDTNRAPWPADKCQEGFQRWVSPRLKHNPDWFI